MLDVETTGLRVGTDRVIEVAVVVMDLRGAVSERWSTLIRPDDRPLTGRLEAVREAPTFAEIAGALRSRLEGCVVAGHNVTFDLRMLEAEFKIAGGWLPELWYFDTHRVATMLEVDTPNRSLAVLCSEMGVPFVTWHTAAGDAEATAALVQRLLERAAGWGRTDPWSLCRSWWSDRREWPVLPVIDRVLVRDPKLFPPAGRQPGAASIFKPSWRRRGDGDRPMPDSGDGEFVVRIDLSETLKKAIVEGVLQALDERDPALPWPESWEGDWIELAEYIRSGGDETETAAYLLGSAMMARSDEERYSGELGEALSTWFEGGFTGLDGIARLETITVVLERYPAEAQSAIDALNTLADLYIRHGGRDAEVTAAFGRALSLAVAWGQAEPADDEWDRPASALSDVVSGWWTYIERRRDVDSLMGLFDRVTHSDAREGRWNTVAELAVRSLRLYACAGEVIVARRLCEQMLQRPTTSWPTAAFDDALERFAAAYEKAGEVESALGVCEAAWSLGHAGLAVANRHSLILERSGRFSDAIDVARRGLDLAPAEQLTKRIVRCARKLT